MAERSPPRDLMLPPPYTAHWLADGDPFDEARRRAPGEGAGCLVWHTSSGNGHAGRFDFAVVLEPEVPLEEARRAFLLGMVALGDALAAHCPPERQVSFAWPGQVNLDSSRLGGVRFATPPGCSEDAVPDWMVLGVELVADRDQIGMPGEFPDSVSLKEEEFTDPAAVLESFASYLMLHFDRWTHDGFGSIVTRYNERMTSDGAVSENGDLVVNAHSEPLASAVETTDWRDERGPIL